MDVPHKLHERVQPLYLAAISLNHTMFWLITFTAIAFPSSGQGDPASPIPAVDPVSLVQFIESLVAELYLFESPEVSGTRKE
jgi:hypothetical protein